MEEEDNEITSREEQEEALVALIEHRTREVNNLRHRLAYTKNQLDDAEKRLKDSESKLARLRGQTTKKITNSDDDDNGIIAVKKERRSNSPIDRNERSYKSNKQSKAELVIPAVTPKISRSSGKGSVSEVAVSSVHTSSVSGGKSDKSKIDQQNVEGKDKGTKRKFEQKEHQELIPLIRKSSSKKLVHCQSSNHISSQHKRKLRSIALCPANDQLFATSALDGLVNFWKVQAKGSSASLLNSTDCASQKQRRWPEDIAWHPEGNRLFSVYTADSGDSQISVTNWNKIKGVERVKFLEDKPHVKGIINGIVFMPWEDTCFVTGGSDHAVVLWREQDDEDKWKPRPLHRNLHSSAVMGVAGMQQKQIVLSAGADRRIFGFDVGAGRAEFTHQIDSKCMSVVPNPVDFNLFMVQTGTHEKQLRLFDIRLRRTELHAFGWKQESSESQSALINQAWSPDGLYITSGSADPVIHIFDIRYNLNRPSQSIKAHQKRVFGALWLQSIPLLISISSDLNIGLHTLMNDSMEAEVVGTDTPDKLAGFIFMCNRMTKPECYSYRVFALPAGRKHIVERINPGMHLFLFDTDVKLLYGIYLATSTGMLNIEPYAFGGRFPAQVSFKILKDCLPLPENDFKHAIKDNYQKHSNKFNPELNIRQVTSLLEMFRPLHVLSTAPRHLGFNEMQSASMLPPTNGVFHQTSRASLYEDTFLSRMSPTEAPRLLNYRHLNRPEEPTGLASSVAAQSVPSQASRNQVHALANTDTPEGTYATRMVNSYTQSLPYPQYAHGNILNHAQSIQNSQHSQPEFHSSMMTMGGSHPQSLQHSQHQHLNVLHPQPQFHASVMTAGSIYSHDQSLQYSQQAHLNVSHPPPEFHTSMMSNSSYTQSLQVPQHPQQNNLNPPPPGVHPPAENVSSNHAQMLLDPQSTHQKIQNPQPGYYPSAANASGSYAQSFQDAQHTYQVAQNVQKYYGSLVNMNHTNVAMQSRASSSFYYPYVTQQVLPGTYAVQGSGPIQEVTSAGQQAAIGSEYCQPYMPT